LDEWAKDLNETSGGMIEVEFAWGGALAGGPELYDALVEGACDAIFFMPYMTPGRFPLADAYTLPLMSKEPTAETLTIAQMDLFEMGYYDQEFSDVKILWLQAPTPSNFFWAMEPARTVEDFAGRKIKFSGGPAKDVVEILGGVPVAMGTAELYEGLEKGTVDGGISGYSVMLGWNLQEVVKSVTLTDFFAVTFAVAMNKDSYNRLPPDAKAIIDGLDNRGWALKAAETFDTTEAEGRAVFADLGIEAYPLPPEEMAKLDTMFAPIWTGWIADTEAKGLPAKEFLADLYADLKDLGVEKPFIGYTPGP
jgi:TRAP-type C4-dicarboxylate transport system substrate-binding protein